jgi:CheY-like chemotaxis protein
VDELLQQIMERVVAGIGSATRSRQRSALGDAIVLVAITGYGRPEDRRKAQEASFDAHLTKPVSADEFAEILSRADGEGAAH